MTHQPSHANLPSRGVTVSDLMAIADIGDAQDPKVPLSDILIRWNDETGCFEAYVVATPGTMLACQSVGDWETP